jgi:putative glutathione S-transferase
MLGGQILRQLHGLNQSSKLIMSRARSALDEMANGEFKRTDSTFRHSVVEPPYSPEAGRYHLYVSYACPWAHRTLIVRALKGLNDAIGVTVVHPTWQKTRPDDPNDKHYGWIFSEDNKGLVPPSGFGKIAVSGIGHDTIGNFNSIRDIYEAVGDISGKYSVPVLYDKKTKTIVNNESAEIIEMLNNNFKEICSDSAPNLSPADLKQAQDEVDKWVYPCINNGVYRCGFAQSQEAYDIAANELFSALDKVEGILSKHRYITGDRLTLSDIRLFVTLIRFDEVYVVYFKCNKKRMIDYPNIRNYIRDIYQIPGVSQTVNMKHIKSHYFTSHEKLNYYSIIPIGPNAESDFREKHDRNRFE